jgi:hypothetical protein
VNPLLEAALARARKGAYVLPLWWTDEAGVCQCPKGPNCPSPGKHPLVEHGPQDASTNSSTIEGWWLRWARANLGVRTDEVPRIDIDLPGSLCGSARLPAGGVPQGTQAGRGRHGLRLDSQQPLTGRDGPRKGPASLSSTTNGPISRGSL